MTDPLASPQQTQNEQAEAMDRSADRANAVALLLKIAASELETYWVPLLREAADLLVEKRGRDDD